MVGWAAVLLALYVITRKALKVLWLKVCAFPSIVAINGWWISCASERLVVERAWRCGSKTDQRRLTRPTLPYNDATT